jgi:uncharacterized protein DUF5676
MEVAMSIIDTQALRLPLVPLGLSLGAFFAVSLLGCILLGIIAPDVTMHRPWLEFFPGFEWLTARSVVIGLIWTQLYGWWVAVVFGSLFNFFAAGSG